MYINFPAYTIIAPTMPTCYPWKALYSSETETEQYRFCCITFGVSAKLREYDKLVGKFSIGCRAT